MRESITTTQENETEKVAEKIGDKLITYKCDLARYIDICDIK